MNDLRRQFPATLQVIDEGIARRLHTGAQLYVSREGETVVDAGVGEARPGVPMTAETITLWLSSGKPITAVALARLWEQGRLDFDAPVARYLPEFGRGGKETISVRHLLTHTSGLPAVETGWPGAAWDEIIAALCRVELPPGRIPGETAAYDVAAGWFLLGEVLRRIDGRPFSQLVREDVFEPLGMRNTWNGMPPDIFVRDTDRIAFMYACERRELTLLPWHAERYCTAPSPGGNTRGPVRELGRFYEMLLAGGTVNGTTLLAPETVSLLTGRHRAGLYDETFRHRMDFGLGFIIDSSRYGAETVPYGFGRDRSSRTFGHGGAQSSLGFCDPDRRLVVAFAFNGRPGEPQHQRRNRTLLEALATDLGRNT